MPNVLYYHLSAQQWSQRLGEELWTMDKGVRESEEHKTSFHIESHLYILGPSPGYGSLQYVTEYRGDKYLHPCNHHHVLHLSYLCSWSVPHHQIIMKKAHQLSHKSGGSQIPIKP